LISAQIVFRVCNATLPRTLQVETHYHHKIFAMLVKGKLVVKLPKHRVDALIASGDGERFDPLHDDRLMKEWVTVAPTSEAKWLPLAREALEFVASKR
jgi:hypothetical protein